MKKIVENTSKYLAMSKEENKEFLDNLYSLMNKLEADVVDYQGLKILSAPPLCPDCRSKVFTGVFYNFFHKLKFL